MQASILLPIHGVTVTYEWNVVHNNAASYYTISQVSLSWTDVHKVMILGVPRETSKVLGSRRSLLI